MSSMKRTFTAALAIALAAACGGGNSATPAVPTCDAACQDAIAIRSLRETLKLAFNLTLQGKPVGHHDESVDCPLGGTVHVVGDATSNPAQGATNVDLVYELLGCTYTLKDDDPKQTYSMSLVGKVEQKGVIAVQPSATTALGFRSGSVSFKGSVYNPAISYEQAACVVVLQQDGNKLSGTLCGRSGTVDL